jgi:8-oxo-dGTP diphosphatase
MARLSVTADRHLILRKDDRVLMGLRKNTGYCDGMYHFPAGHLEPLETFAEGACREGLEELGVVIDPSNLKVAFVLHNFSNTPRVGLFYSATEWRNDLVNAEPDKCERIDWFTTDEIAAMDNVVPYAKHVIAQISKGLDHGDFGDRAVSGAPRDGERT